MSEQVKRYGPNFDVPIGVESMLPCGWGLYVLHSDYIRAEQANAELRAEVERLRAEVERLNLENGDLQLCKNAYAKEVLRIASNWNDMKAKAARQTARVEALTKVLRMFWQETIENDYCPICDCHKHAPDCALAAALSQPEAGT